MGAGVAAVCAVLLATAVSSAPAPVLAGVSLLAGLVLLAVGDIRGGAAAIGAGAGALLTRAQHRTPALSRALR